MKKITCILLSLIIATGAFGICACSGETDEHEKLTVYFIDGSIPNTLIDLYNAYCLAGNFGTDGAKYQIELVESEDLEDLYTKMNTEIMSGRGPDLFFTTQNFPMEKMANSEAFADIDELMKEQGKEFDAAKYNNNVMDAGVWNGKRYIVPALFNINTLSSSKDRLKSTGLPEKQGYTPEFSDKNLFREFLKKDSGYSLFPSYSASAEGIIREMLQNFVDFKAKVTEFDTQEFRDSLDNIQNVLDMTSTEEDLDIPDDIFDLLIQIKNVPKSDLPGDIRALVEKYSKLMPKDNYIFDVESSTLMDAIYNVGTTEYKNGYERIHDDKSAEQAVVWNGFARKGRQTKGSISLGVAVNRNSKKKAEACEFISFMLSEQCQRKLSNPTGNYSMSAYPVLNNVMKERIEESLTAEDDLFNPIKTDTEYVKTYMKIIDSVKEFDFSYNYYYANIAEPLLTKYINGEISKDKLIRQLSSATKFYLEE